MGVCPDCREIVEKECRKEYDRLVETVKKFFEEIDNVPHDYKDGVFSHPKVLIALARMSGEAGIYKPIEKEQ